MAIIGLAQVGGPLLPLDGAHLLLAELLPLLPWDLDGVVLRHGRRRVARPAEEAQLRGTGESGPRRDTLALGTAPRARGTGACAGAGPSLGTHPKRAGACALHRRLCNHAPALQTLARPGLGTANSCTIACRHCKPTYTHTANPRTPTHQHCKSSHVPVWTLQTLTHPCTSTANPRTSQFGRCKPSHTHTAALQTLVPSTLTPHTHAHPHGDPANPRPSASARRQSPRTPAQGGCQPSHTPAHRCSLPTGARAGEPCVTARPPVPASPPRRAAGPGGPGNS